MLKRVSEFIVDRRVVFFALFAVLVVYSVLSIGRVSVNSDLTASLPADTPTRQGLTIMEDEFTTYATANVMVSNIAPDKARELADEIEGVPCVASVSFDDTAEHYASSAALFTITFRGGPKDDAVIAAMDDVVQLLDGREVSVSTSVGQNYSAQLASEMGRVLVLAIIVIIAVLLFTSKSYFEVVVFIIVFVVAILMNMGTNYWLGEISSITNSIAPILQLALAIDYAIIFCHRFQDEYGIQGEVRPALIDALARSIVEISSSSLTTISGLVALTLMQYRLGWDLGMVLTKGIICSLLTVFLLMPGLVMVFHKPLIATRHRKLVPDITRWGAFLAKGKPNLLAVFVFILPFALVGSALCGFGFTDSAVDRVTPSEQDKVNQRIHDTFDETSAIAVLAPAGDYAAEKALLREIEALPQVKAATGLANIEIEEGRVLTDPYTPRAFSELIGVDIEQAKLLYALYGYDQGQYQPILGDSDAYAVPLVDMLEFLFETIDSGAVTLEGERKQDLDDLRQTLDDALAQLRGTDHVRMAITATVPAQGDESYALVGQIEDMARAQFGDGVLVIGDVTSARDLQASFTNDNRLISLLTILFVFCVLLLTFRSAGAAAMLILVIQGSIWINFSFPTITGTTISFLTYLIVCAIQMGATIDYAIVLYNRFQSHKRFAPAKEAMAQAVNGSFPTILTSGSIMTAAGFIIAFMTTDPYISSIGLALGRGALISVVLVLTVLPQLLLRGDRFAERTTVDFKKLLGGGVRGDAAADAS